MDEPTGRVADQWKAFAALVLPPTVSKVQYTEMRRAFYAGALGLMDSLSRAMSDDDHETQEDLNVIAELQAEFRDWERRMKRGEV